MTSKPETVSQEAWDAAVASWNQGRGIADIARAIMAAKAEEREAIAELVDVFADTADFSAMNVEHPNEVARYRSEEATLKGVAAAIRKRGGE